MQGKPSLTSENAPPRSHLAHRCTPTFSRPSTTTCTTKKLLHGLAFVGHEEAVGVHPRQGKHSPPLALPDAPPRALGKNPGPARAPSSQRAPVGREGQGAHPLSGGGMAPRHCTAHDDEGPAQGEP